MPERRGECHEHASELDPRAHALVAHEHNEQRQQHLRDEEGCEATRSNEKQSGAEKHRGHEGSAHAVHEQKQSESTGSDQKESEGIRSNQKQPGATRSNQKQPEATRSSQKQSEATRSNQKRSEAIRSNQKRSEAIGSNQEHQKQSGATRSNRKQSGASEAIRSNQKQPEAIGSNQEHQKHRGDEGGAHAVDERGGLQRDRHAHVALGVVDEARGDLAREGRRA